MTIEELQPLLTAGNITEIKSVFEMHCGERDFTEAFRQYDQSKHDVMDPIKRRDKSIVDEKEKVIGTVKVCRLPLPIQKKIVKTAAMFLGSPEIKSTPKGDVEEKMNAGILKVWNDNKMSYKFKEIIKKTLSETECAVIWYTQKADDNYWNGTKIKSKFRLRAKLIGPSFGDTLYPVYDDFGDMIAFGRYYKIKDIEGKEIEYFDIETATDIYTSNNKTGSWVVESAKNEIGKIRIVFFKHALAWEDVQLLIDRLEIIGSKHADTNDYNGMPILVGSGKIISMSGKEESGKVVELENGAKLDYLVNNAPPESVKMEMDRLDKYINSLSHTPDISLDSLKEIGYLPKAGFKALFMDAHLNAADNEQVFGEGAQRMINLLKAALSKLDSSLATAMTLPITPEFTYFLPEDITEDLDNIIKSKEAGILSEESAIKLNSLVNDKEAELEAIKAEKASKPAPIFGE